MVVVVTVSVHAAETMRLCGTGPNTCWVCAV